MSSLYYEKSKSDYDKYKVVVTNSETQEFIDGLLNNEMSLGLQADIESSLISGIESGVKGAMESVVGKAGGLAGDMMSKINSQYKTLWSTLLGYSGSSSPPNFTINFHVLASTTPYSTTIGLLNKFVLPKVTSPGSIMYSHLYSPTDYVDGGSSGGFPLDGKLAHVAIGDWFFATGLLCNGVDYSFSKYINTDGKPNYLSVSMSFTSYRVLNDEELSRWFLK